MSISDIQGVASRKKRDGNDLMFEMTTLGWMISTVSPDKIDAIFEELEPESA